MAGKQLVKILGTKRLREVETLRHRAAEHSEPGELVLGLYPLRHRRYTHGISEVDDGPDDRRVHRTVGDALYESAIHLYFLYRELLQVRKTSGSVLAGRDRMLGRRPASGMVFVMLATRKFSHEARAAFIPRRHNAVEPRIQYVLAQ